MLKNLVVSGTLSTIIGVHLIQAKQTKENIQKYCPAFTK